MAQKRYIYVFSFRTDNRNIEVTFADSRRNSGDTKALTLKFS
jgi:hypothetical protein